MDLVLNSLTGPGFIDESLACLTQGGRFVELSKRDIWPAEKMAAARPDVDYHVLALDLLAKDDPERVGAVLRSVMAKVEAGELESLIYSAWPLAEAGAAMEFMRSGRHMGKIVLTKPPLTTGRLRENGTYLVTGGLGGIGQLVAGWLADRGAQWIVLNGRRKPDAGAEAAIRELRERGVSVSVELADVADEAAVEGMLERIGTELPPLSGVVHSAGALADAALGNQTWERFERVLGAKMLGAWHLHRATQNLDLDLFVLFSSISGVLGSAAQANHAAANAFLDQLARHRRAMGLAGQSIAWGAWSGLGEAEERRARIAARMEAAGIGWMTPRQGLRAFDLLVRRATPTSLVAPVEWPTLASLYSSSPPLLEEMLSETRGLAVSTSAAPGELEDRLREAPANEHEALLVTFLQRELQAVLRLDSPPEPTAGFFDLGLDSLMAVELRNRLSRALAGRYEISNTAVFDHPNAAALARHLAGEMKGPEAAMEPAERDVPAVPAKGAVAIIGMACRFPGGPDLDGFWRLLEYGGDAVKPDRPEAGVARAPIGWGAYVDGIDRFDATLFGITPMEACLLDPQQRMLLETSWAALEEAGIAPDGLRGSRTGVYAGISGSDYRDVLVNSGQFMFGMNVIEGTVGSTAIGRVAFTLGLEGPAIPVDTACSSSLVAVHQALAALRLGETDLALAGGVNAILSPAAGKAFAEVGLVSREGKCKAFDAEADGYVRGEGCGMVVLKRLEDAEADGDRVWAVIRGSAVNNNGAGAGLTMLNGPAQERVIAEALSRAGLEPADVDYLEAHGTGTELGDPIELHAAGAVYGRGRSADRPLLVGSVKTNIGHLETAAGISGLIKAVLSMNRGLIPRHLHFREPSPRVDWERLPLRVTSEETAWPDTGGRPARSAVSSFGFSGTNAHVIVERYGALVGSVAGPARQVAVSLPADAAGGGSESADRSRRTRMLPLSGKSAGAVRALATRYLEWLDERADRSDPDPADPGPSAATCGALLGDMAWTAGAGRSHSAWRAGLVFSDVAELRNLLEQLSAGETSATVSKTKKVSFVFAGEGCQYLSMGEALYEAEPVVRTVLDCCDRVIRDLRGASLLEVMFGTAEARGDLDSAEWAQPSLYALECALVALWESVGIRPAAVLGYGVGELAASQAAGVFGLEDGLRVAAARGELMAALTSGRMETEVAEPDAALQARATPRGTEAGESAHSEASSKLPDGLADPLLDEFEAVVDSVATDSPGIPVVSSLTSRVADSGEVLDGAYWRRQVQQRAEAGAGVAALVGIGADVIVEIGPDATLALPEDLARPSTAEAAGQSGDDVAQQELAPDESTRASLSSPAVLASLRRTSSRAPDATDAGDGSIDRTYMESVAQLYQAGATLSFEGLFAGEPRRRVSVPGYPFERRRHWIDPAKE